MRIALGLPSRVADASGEMMLDWATRADRGPFPAWLSLIALCPRRSNRWQSWRWRPAPRGAFG